MTPRRFDALVEDLALTGCSREALRRRGRWQSQRRNQEEEQQPYGEQAPQTKIHDPRNRPSHGPSTSLDLASNLLNLRVKGSVGSPGLYRERRARGQRIYERLPGERGRARHGATLASLTC